jgi:hypothetical protein
MYVIIIDHFIKEWMPMCMILMEVQTELSKIASPKSRSMEILNQKHWSLGRKWTS